MSEQILAKRIAVRNRIFRPDQRGGKVVTDDAAAAPDHVVCDHSSRRDEQALLEHLLTQYAA